MAYWRSNGEAAKMRALARGIPMRERAKMGAASSLVAASNGEIG